MRLGRVTGRVWATIKDPKLTGIKLAIVQPLDEKENPVGQPLVATDVMGTDEGNLVYWVTGPEATFALKNRQFPSDASIIGFVDRLDS